MDIQTIHDTIDRALTAAGLRHDTREPGRLGSVRKIIDDALAAAGLKPRAERERADLPQDARALEGPGRAARTIDTGEDVGTGDFVTARHSSTHGTLGYKLYVPAAQAQRARPLIVMLHGCKQDPDDFAAGTRMNELAERHGFLVAYPEQSPRANGGRCWNWFESAQQDRDGAEAALIAGIVRDIAERHALESGRVFVAGLSAGAAMAAILGQVYPDVFAGIAVHSGLPVGAAHDMPSAFAAMQGRGAVAAKPHTAGRGVPTIVFHGDADATVTIANGKAVALDAVAAFEREGKGLERMLRIDTPVAGRRCTATEFADESGRTLVEEWVVHGGGHAWFGGSPAGSFTDAAGPDASAEIVRFFLQR